MFDRRGVLVGEAGSAFDVGRWAVTDDGQTCRPWKVWGSARRRSFHLFRDGDALVLQTVDRWSVLKLRRLPAP